MSIADGKKVDIDRLKGYYRALEERHPEFMELDAFLEQSDPQPVIEVISVPIDLAE